MIFNIRVTGVTVDNRQKLLEKLSKRPQNHAYKFRLQKEPENEYDPFAIAVYSEDLNKKIGYVPKDINQLVNEKLDSGAKFNVSGDIVGGYSGKFYGVVLKCEVENDNDFADIFVGVKND